MFLPLDCHRPDSQQQSGHNNDIFTIQTLSNIHLKEVQTNQFECVTHVSVIANLMSEGANKDTSGSDQLIILFSLKVILLCLFVNHLIIE